MTEKKWDPATQEWVDSYLTAHEEPVSNWVNRVVLAVALVGALVVGLGIYLTQRPVPEQALVYDVVEYVATHPKTDAAVAELADIIRESGCDLMSFVGLPVPEDKVQDVVENVPAGSYVAFHQITYGDHEGNFYVVVIEADCG